MNPDTGFLTVKYNNHVNLPLTVSTIQKKLVDVTTTSPDGSINTVQMTSNIPVSADFTLRVAQTPSIVLHTTLIQVPLDTSDHTISEFRFDVQSHQYAIGVGPLTWTVSPLFYGLAINSVGILTVAPYTKYFNDDVTIIARNEALGSSQPIVRLVVAQRPIIVETVIEQTIDSTDEYIHPPLQVNKRAVDTGPLTWTMIQSSSSFIVMDKMGQVRVQGEQFVRLQTIRVRVTNVVSGFDEKVITLTVLRMPFLQLPSSNFLGTPVVSIAYDSSDTFTYQVQQLRTGTEQLTWSLTSSPDGVPTGTSVPGLFIDSSTGSITVLASQQILKYVTVRVVNIIRDSREITFLIQKIKQPVLATIPDISVTLTTSDWTYQVVETNGTTGAIQWRVTGGVDGLSIDNNGLLKFARYHFVNQQVTVIATNDLGQDSNHVTFTLTIGQHPIITMWRDEFNVTNDTRANYTHQFSQTATELQTGPLSWSLENNLSPTALSIDSVTGIMSVLYGYSVITPIDSPMYLRVTNVNGDYDQKQLTLNILHAIDLSSFTAPIITIGSMADEPTTITTFADIFNAQRRGVGLIIWTITSTLPEQLVIDGYSGVITFAKNGFINEIVSVTATNNMVPLGYKQTVSFILNIGQAPLINNPGTLFIQGNDIRTFHFQFISLVSEERTGKLTWAATQLDGLDLNQDTGLMTYDMLNIQGFQKLEVTTL
jgi:hypothetical protein